jgi:hypothetical protein|tara:strand:+ start:515 stop:679 length:165 start_codon:yes stop_codon:yes gene_type:complete
MDTPTYHPRYVKPLEEIAKEQALQDIVMGSFDENGDIADWSTCFEVQCIDDIPW